MFPSGTRKVSQVQVPSDSGSTEQLSAAAGQLGARLIQVVHLEQRDDARAVAAVALEVAVAGAE